MAAAASLTSEAAPLAGDAELQLRFVHGVLALCGAAVDRAGRAGCAAGVPEDWQRRRRDRDGDGFHITFLGKADLQRLADALREGGTSIDPALRPAEGHGLDLDGIVCAVVRHLADGACGLTWVDAGEGRVSDGDCVAAFRVIVWPAATRARKLLGLAVHDFHLTLGFSRSDVHGKAKGLASLVAGVLDPAAVVPLASAARRLAASATAADAGPAESAAELAQEALQGGEAHGDAGGQVAALEALCLAYGRLQQPRRVVEAADRLLELDGASLAGNRSKAVALMALKRYAEAHPVLERLAALVAGMPEGGERTTLEGWLSKARSKCGESLGLVDRLFPGCEDKATEAGDDEFETSFFTSGSALKFPSTAHLKNLGAATRDDKLCDEARRKRFCGGQCVISVEEKVDGANLGISLDSAYRPRMQNRSKMVNWKTDTQFAGLEQWLNDFSPTLCKILERNNDILFGEWCAYLHTVKYNRLPGYFLAFDIYDKRRGRFLSREALHTRLQRASGPKIPAVPMLCPPRIFASAAEVEELLQRQSSFGTGFLEGVYLRIDEPAPELGQRETCLVDRCKLVRAEFQQAIEDEGSWRGRGKNDLDMALVSAYTEQCYPCALATA